MKNFHLIVQHLVKTNIKFIYNMLHNKKSL